MASITIVNKTAVAWSAINFKVNHGKWKTEPGNLPTDETPVKFELDDTGSPFGVDGLVEYAGPGEGKSKAMASIIFKSPLTNVNLIEAHISDASYKAEPEYDEDGDLVGV